MIASALRACAAFALLTTSVHATEILTARGPVQIEVVPETIAVFDIAAIDTLSALGVDIQGLPNNLYLSELAPLAETAETVGSLFDPDLEALNALGPDLIIVGGRSSTELAQVQRVAPAIDMTMDGADLIQQARDNLLGYGALFGRQDQAQTLVAAFDQTIEDTKTAVAGRGNALIVMTNGPRITVYGPQSRFGWVHEALDLPSAIETSDASIHGDAVSFEFVRDVDPDWMIVLDRAAAIGSADQNARATLDNALVRETAAWQNDRIIYLPAADFYIAAGGIQATTRVLDQLADAFLSAR
jgi:iron complex transport system substrate-binding protein